MIIVSLVFYLFAGVAIGSAIDPQELTDKFDACVKPV